MTGHFNLLNRRGSKGEDLFNTHAKGDAADGEGFGDSLAIACDDVAGEDLSAETGGEQA